ncbi:MAG: hypothetical protein KDI50_03785 [Candidatus Competibacteraceae bacterium]|nr:hypothetical protein [Candidatus Competibacteraceae bacterium]
MKLDIKQPSSWRGILGLLSVIGISIDPDLLDQIVLLLGAGISIIEIVRNERSG